MTSLHDPVPEKVRVELKRLEQRWAQLPRDRALGHAGSVHAYVVELARLDPGQTSCGSAHEVLGEPRPEWIMDQLRAVLFDLCAAGTAPGDVPARLADLRAELA